MASACFVPGRKNRDANRAQTGISPGETDIAQPWIHCSAPIALLLRQQQPSPHCCSRNSASVHIQQARSSDAMRLRAYVISRGCLAETRRLMKLRLLLISAAIKQGLPSSRKLSMTIQSINARNQFKGTIKEIVHGPVVSEVEVDTPFGIVTSVITTRSIKDLDLRIGSEVLALVKSTEVSIAKL